MRLTHDREIGVGDAKETEGARVVSFVCELPKVTGAPAATVPEEEEEDGEGRGTGWAAERTMSEVDAGWRE